MWKLPIFNSLSVVVNCIERMKGNKGLRLTMDQFRLFAFYSRENLNAEWAKSESDTHVCGRCFCQNVQKWGANAQILCS